jgi:hypothetical protein
VQRCAHARAIEAAYRETEVEIELARTARFEAVLDIAERFARPLVRR